MKVLIAENDLLSRLSLQDILVRNGVIHTANDGQEVLDAYSISLLGQKDPYDIIFLDTGILTCDSLDVIKTIREMEKNHGIGGKDIVHFVLTMPHAEKKMVLSLFLKGICQAFLEKPISPENVAEFFAKYESVFN